MTMIFPLRAATLAAVLLGGASGALMAQDAASVSALTISVAPPETRDWPVEIEASGWLAAWQEAVISSEVGGQKIIAINADVGDTVAAGDLLVELSAETIETDIRQLEAALDSAKAGLEQAGSDADRARRLDGSGSISQQQATEYLVTERQAQAEVASAEAELAAAELDLARTRITAMSDGVITSREAALGDVVSAGDGLFRMIRDNRIEWQAEVPVRQIFSLEAGTQVRIPGPQGDITGHVRRIAPTASDSNGRITVYVALDPVLDAPEPKVGVMVSGLFDLGVQPALTVASSAVVLTDGFSYVYVLEGESTVRRQKVETGRRRDDRIEITEGLAQDAAVVISGGAFLSDGATVTVTEGRDAE